MEKDPSVTAADVGKLMMNDGSGTAKVYQYSPATSQQLGRWKIKINALSDTTDDTNIEIDSLNHFASFTRVDWRTAQNNPPVAPPDALTEMLWIKDYIDNHPDLAHLTTSMVSGELIIEENTFDATEIFVEDAEELILVVDTISVQALPAAPTSFPLGKLLGVDGSNALISTNMIETYILDGTININQDLFNMAIDIDFNNTDELYNLFEHIVIPAPDGKVKTFNPDDFGQDETFTRTFRHFIVGIPITSTSNTVTVMSLQQFSFLLSIFARLRNKGVIGS